MLKFGESPREAHALHTMTHPRSDTPKLTPHEHSLALHRKPARTSGEKSGAPSVSKTGPYIGQGFEDIDGAHKYETPQVIRIVIPHVV